MKSFMFKTTSKSNGILSGQLLNVNPGVNSGVINYRVNNVPDGIGMTECLLKLTNTIILDKFILDYEEIGDGRIVRN